MKPQIKTTAAIELELEQRKSNLLSIDNKLTEASNNLATALMTGTEDDEVYIQRLIDSLMKTYKRTAIIILTLEWVLNINKNKLP